MGAGTPDIVRYEILYSDTLLPVTPPETQRRAAMVMAGHAHGSDELGLVLEALGIHAVNGVAA